MRPFYVASRRRLWSLVLISLILLPLRSQAAVATMTTEELRAQLESPDLVIVDVRTGQEWQTSDSKIKGAIRVETDALETFASTRPKDKTIVFYCS